MMTYNDTLCCEMWRKHNQALGRRFFSHHERRAFDKILIANRGEIACRVMKTARRLGIKTVAIYSEADANALHVRMADEAYCVGPPPSSQSYLNIPEIIKVIKATGAQAVHPGYGFLSENYKFCDELGKVGVEFIGPSAESIHKMGDKIESKLIAKSAGVHTIPGFDGVVPDADEAVKISGEIGYPVMIKASAGGGGKGMRIAWNEKEVRENFKIAATESKSSFGDDRLLIEKFIEQPRHIEIQLIGDKHGNIIYLPERECSIQRRNQKVIEEAPSPAIDPETRKRMGEQAVQLARKVGYFSAGTVEFLLDAKKNFYFLEMNTRLQVEHPITEYITGLDLVEQMIKVAAGERLSFTQDEVQIRGWAIESRVYAEDPKLYLPCIGRLNRYLEPDQSLGNVRCDTGIVEGSEISIYYDPLICKLSTFGRTREEALKAMGLALDSYVIKGLTHNIPLLREVISHPRFQSGQISTKFLAEEYPTGFAGHQLSEIERSNLCVVATAIHSSLQRKLFNDSAHFVGLEKVFVRMDGEKTFSKVELSNGNGFKVNEEVFELKDFHWDGISPLITCSLGGSSIVVQMINRIGLGFDLSYKGTVYSTEVLSETEHMYHRHMKSRPISDHSMMLIAPMPGQVVSVTVKEGDVVKQGSDLLVIEAMKMQNVMKAAKAFRIKKLNVKEGQNVASEEVLIEFEAVQ